MNSRNWGHIYDEIEAEKWRVHAQRIEAYPKPIEGLRSVEGEWGIAILDDPFALRWQRLDRIQSHVGLHFCAANNREHGMKNSKCDYVEDVQDA